MYLVPALATTARTPPEADWAPSVEKEQSRPALLLVVRGEVIGWVRRRYRNAPEGIVRAGGGGASAFVRWRVIGDRVL